MRGRESPTELECAVKRIEGLEDIPFAIQGRDINALVPESYRIGLDDDVPRDADPDGGSKGPSEGEAKAKRKKVKYQHPVPAMPLLYTKSAIRRHTKHRKKVPFHHPVYNAMVARPVGKAELLSNEDARRALESEWTYIAQFRPF